MPVTVIERQGRIGVAAVCERYGVSEATARRDLEALASLGKAQRVHGGAIALCQAPPEGPVLPRSQEQAEEKRLIGRAAAKLVQDGDTILSGILPSNLYPK